MNDVTRAAREYLALGLTPIAIALDGTKSPHKNAGLWRRFIKKPPTEKQLAVMFAEPCGIAILGGATSGNLEIIDFDRRDALAPWQELVHLLDPSLLERLPMVMTPNGWHLYYRCENPEGNQKLAMERSEDGKLKTKIETRGEGGYVLAPPSPPEAHPSGKTYEWQTHLVIFDKIPMLTAEERQTLLDAARSFNEVAEASEPDVPHTTTPNGAGRPGDDFADKTSWGEILKPHGWSAVRELGRVTHWRRPGKDDKGISATTGYTGDKLYVFSSNAQPFTSQRAYGKFSAYAWLNTAGDFSAAARELKAKGFGEQRQPVNRPSRQTFEDLNRRLEAMSSPQPPSEAPPPLDTDAPADLLPAIAKRITASQLEAMMDDDPAAPMRDGIFERIVAMREDRAEWLLIGDLLRRKKKKSDFNAAVKVYDTQARRRENSDGWKVNLLWREAKDGTPILDKCVTNVIEILSNDSAWLGVLALDEFSNQIVTRNPPPFARDKRSRWSDADVTETRSWIERAYAIRPSEGDVNAAIIVVAKRFAFSSIKEYFEALEPVQGESSLDTWLIDFFGAPDTPYARAVGAKWMISAVARAYDPGCKVDTMLILEGKQGMKKSRVLEQLCPDIAWFTDGLSEFGSKDQASEIEGKFIVELAELKGFGREIDQVKAFVTRRHENYRPAYGRHVIQSPRKCVFAGTVNPSATGYLKDETGNRRFWPVKCEKKSIELTAVMRDKLWSEAKQRYQAGEKWWLEEEELIAEATAEQAERLATDPWQELIERHLVGEVDTSVNEILEKLKIDVGKRELKESMRVGRILTLMGWVKHNPTDRQTGKRNWRYRSPSYTQMSFAA